MNRRLITLLFLATSSFGLFAGVAVPLADRLKIGVPTPLKSVKPDMRSLRIDTPGVYVFHKTDDPQESFAITVTKPTGFSSPKFSKGEWTITRV